MIWHTKKFEFIEEGKSYKANIKGHYNNPPSSSADSLSSIGNSIIEIVLTITEDDDAIVAQKVMYSHNPSMMKYEDPSEEDILNRYNSNFQKVVKKVSVAITSNGIHSIAGLDWFGHEKDGASL
jgi:hypothetical protein